jgi:macrophage erythroblast attacher
MFLETHHTLFTLPQKPLLTIALSAGLSALKTPACHSRFVSPSSGLNSSTSPKPHYTSGGDPYDSEDITMSMSLDSITALEANETSQHITPSIGASLQTSVCPICSTELNKLARNVPYAHHSKSHVENDALVLPNGRIYGRERLERTNEKLGAPKGVVRDPVDPSVTFAWDEVRKVFIS